jgi:hypothetical protein
MAAAVRANYTALRWLRQALRCYRDGAIGQAPVNSPARHLDQLRVLQRLAA